MAETTTTTRPAAESSSGNRNTSNSSNNNNSRRRRNRGGDSNAKKNASADAPTPQHGEPSTSSASQTSHRPSRPPVRKPVGRPNPKNQEKLGKRQIEINQLKRGYPDLVESENGLAYLIKLRPSDPDFPFDIEVLRFNMFVPKDYPQSSPYIAILNEDIPRGFGANVESGFRALAARQLGKLTLMNLTIQLDRQLEEFLSRERQSTVKLVRQKKRPSPEPTASDKPSRSSTPKSSKSPKPALNFQNVFVPQHIKDERLRQIEQLKHRVDAKLFSEASSGSTFTIYIDPAHSGLVPDELLHFRAMIYVPADYSMSACSLTIPSVQDVTARNIEENFNLHASATKSWSLLAQVNYLATQTEQLMLPNDNSRPVTEKRDEEQNTNGSASEHQYKRVGTMPANGDEGEDDHDKDDEHATGESADEDTKEEEDVEDDRQMDMPSLDLRGTALMLPGLTLSHIGFLECQTLNIVVKCTRCKTQNDMLNLVSAPYGRESKAIGIACSKCNATLACSFRKDIVHQNNIRCGLLDFSNCTPFDMLPSSFLPTCGQCSASLDQPFRKMELGKTSNATCRECHTKMSMFIPGYRFDLISEDSMGEARLKLRVKRVSKENLGITGGTALPEEGSCSHYKKSHRWFRFSCCGKVFPCDKCHDDKSDHSNERAHRMICGKCSREQNFGPVCVYCRNTFETRHSGFWEGGTGERNKARLSRKDPRKYSKKGVSRSALKANS